MREIEKDGETYEVHGTGKNMSIRKKGREVWTRVKDGTHWARVKTDHTPIEIRKEKDQPELYANTPHNT